MASSADHPQQRPRRHWRRQIAFVALALAAVVAVLEWIEWPFLRLPLQSKLTDALHRKVEIGDDFGIRLIGHLRAHADLFVIGAALDGPALNGKAPELVRATDLRLSLPWTTVIDVAKGNVEQRPRIVRLKAEKLDATLLRDTDGRSNWQVGEQKHTQTDDAPPPIPAFERLAIADGHLVVVDVAKQLDLRVNLRTREGSETQAGAPEGQPDATTGLTLTAEGSYRGQDVRGSLHSSGLLALATSNEELPAVPVRLEIHAGATEVSFNGTTRDVLQLGGVDGNYEVAGPSLAAVGEAFGLTLPTTNTFAMSGHLKKDGEIWSSEVKSLDIGRSQLAGNFRYDPTPAVPKLTGKLGGRRLALLDLGPVVGSPPRPHSARAAITPHAIETADSAGSRKAPTKPKPPAQADSIAEARRLGARRAPVREKVREKASAQRPSDAKAENPAANTKGRVLPQRDFDIPSLAAMDADVEVDLQEFNLGTPALEDFAPFRTHVLLDSQHLRLENIVASTAGGEMRGNFELDAKPEKPLWNVELHWTDVDLAKFVKTKNVADANPKDGGKATTARGTSGGYVSGTLGGKLKLHGSGRSTAAMLASLDGTIQLWVRNGAISHFLVELAGIDVAQALGMLITGDDSLPMQCAVAAFKVRDGTIAPQVAVVETSDSTLKVEGNISLADERLDLVLKAQPKDISPLSLRSPVYIEGSFAKPEVRLDKTGIGLRVIAAAALAAVTPVAALLALVDIGEPEKRACEDAIVRAQGGESAGQK